MCLGITGLGTLYFALRQPVAYNAAGAEQIMNQGDWDTSRSSVFDLMRAVIFG